MIHDQPSGPDRPAHPRPGVALAAVRDERLRAADRLQLEPPRRRRATRSSGPTTSTSACSARPAESVAEHMRKGSRVAVDGRLAWREWETPDEQRRQAVSIVADTVQFLERPGDATATGGEREAARRSRRAGRRRRPARQRACRLLRRRQRAVVPAQAGPYARLAAPGDDCPRGANRCQSTPGIGKTYEPVTYAVGREKIREYARAVGETDPAVPRSRGRARGRVRRPRRAADVRRRLQRPGGRAADLRPGDRAELRDDGPRRPGVRVGRARRRRRRDHDDRVGQGHLRSRRPRLLRVRVGLASTSAARRSAAAPGPTSSEECERMAELEAGERRSPS